MPTYIYECSEATNSHGEFEVNHSINDELTECPFCKEEGKKANKPKRLISTTSFVLVGSGWARDNYK